VLHYAAKCCFPFDAIASLIEAVGIDAQDSEGFTAAMICANYGRDDLLHELANMKADLSIVNNNGENIFGIVNENRAGHLSDEEKADVLSVLAEHGVTSAKIAKGFRSTLHESIHIA
jgi:ankyrin repeat protein